MSRQSVVLLGIAAIFAAMLGRMGWIDWLQLLGVAGLIVGAILALLAGAAIFIALPVFLLWTVIRAVAGRVLPSRLKAPAPSPAEQSAAPPAPAPPPVSMPAQPSGWRHPAQGPGSSALSIHPRLALRT